MSENGVRRALLVDYGGVLTPSLGAWFGRADDLAGLPRGTLTGVIVDAYTQPEGDSFIHRFERGEIDARAFRAAIDDELRARGHDPGGADVLGAVMDGFVPDVDRSMWDLVGSARDQGVATALLSNSWGTEGYPVDDLRTVFDALVISGEVGLRKPDPAIYHLAAERLEVPVDQCVFIDDFDMNVQVAIELGMVGIVHSGDVEVTRAAVEDALGLPLA